MRIRDKFHLTYCTNIHPGEDWQETFEHLEQHVPEIKKQLTPDQRFGVGLRLSNLASEELGLKENLIAFKQWLDTNGLYVFTMNGFPYGSFHGTRVKDQVHAPDWTTKERLDYTQHLFKQLAFLVPDGISGGISTSPISYKHWHTTEAKTKEAFTKGAEQMVEVAAQLFEIEQQESKYLHLDIEPEPDGLLENTDEVLLFFQDYLIPIGTTYFQNEFQMTAEIAEAKIKRYLTVCYDVCHFALAFEDPKETFKKFEVAGIEVGKIQVSSALKVNFDPANEQEIWKALQQFDESTYLHQVTEQKNGKVQTYNDLPSILEAKQAFDEIRAHFHVPIFLEHFGLLGATQEAIVKVAAYLKQHAISQHLEVETYTWDVLPDNLSMTVTDGIVRELNWFKNEME